MKSEDNGGRTIKPVVRQVSMAKVDDAEGGQLRFAFHGATKVMLTHVFQKLKGKLYRDYAIQDSITEWMRNGRSYHTLFVCIVDPILNHLDLKEWPAIIKCVMERTFRCRVIYFDKYEKLLNT